MEFMAELFAVICVTCLIGAIVGEIAKLYLPSNDKISQDELNDIIDRWNKYAALHDEKKR